MSTVKVAINGFGRIGRLVYRQIYKMEGIDVVAINDLTSPKVLAHLLKYDTAQGRFDADVKATENSIVVNGDEVKIYAQKNPAEIPWKSHDVDVVLECTGFFTDKAKAEAHLTAGAKKVVISAPATGDLKTIVFNVNHSILDGSETIISCASCTTNCLAVLTERIVDNFGIEEGLMTTVHSLTASQPTVDGPSKKDWRGGRAAGLNIIPSSTGAAKAVRLCLPEVKGKLTGMAFRVPTPDVSVVDLTVRLKRDTTYDEICAAMKKAADATYKGLLEYCEEEVVSSDFIGTPYSCIFDKKAGIALNSRFYKLIAWYDNEMGYSHRVVDLMRYITSKEKQ